MSVTPSIYGACLASYNNGILHGAWIDATQEIDEINLAINQMLKSSPIEDAEEYVIHDYEGFETATISEYQGIEQVQKLAQFIEENGLLGAELYNHFSNLEEAKTYLEDNYVGVFESVEDYARQLTDETTQIPAHLECYVDFSALARDLEISRDIFTIQTPEGYHVFWG